MKHNRLWTKEEEAALEKMCALHLTPDDMLPVFKCRTRDAIERKIQRRKLKYLKEPEIDMEAFKKIMGSKNGIHRT